MKKAYIKTLEAIIAAVLILVAIFAILPKTEKKEAFTPDIVKSSQQFILKQIANNESLRSCVVFLETCDLFYIERAIIENLPPGYDYTFKICSSPNCLADTPIDRSVFMDDTLISSDSKKQNPKIVRIWFWKK